MEKTKQIKVLHLPTNVGGNSWALSRAERELGLKSDVLVKQIDIFSEKYDILFKTEANKLKYMKKIYNFYKKAVKKYDIFHFNFGQSLVMKKNNFLNMIDLKYLKYKKKGIFVTYQGNDARSASYCVNNYDITYFSKEDIVKNERSEKYKERNKKSFDKYADCIYTTNPDLINVLPEKTKFRPYTKIDLNEWKFIDESNYNKKELIISHAPSDRKIKGTEYIIEAIKKLQKENYSIKLNLIENIPNKKVKEFYQKTDLFIDQLLVGWYGGVSVELMALGKPVIVFLREKDLIYIPKEMRDDLPFINANPKTIYQVIKEWYKNKKNLKEKAIQCRKFVEKWHDPVKNAKKIICDYRRVLEDKNKYF